MFQLEPPIGAPTMRQKNIDLGDLPTLAEVRFVLRNVCADADAADSGAQALAEGLFLAFFKRENTLFIGIFMKSEFFILRV